MVLQSSAVHLGVLSSAFENQIRNAVKKKRAPTHNGATPTLPLGENSLVSSTTIPVVCAMIRPVEIELFSYEKMTFFHSTDVNCTCFSAQSTLFSRCRSVMNGAIFVFLKERQSVELRTLQTVLQLTFRSSSRRNAELFEEFFESSLTLRLRSAVISLGGLPLRFLT